MAQSPKKPSLKAPDFFVSLASKSLVLVTKAACTSTKRADTATLVDKHRTCEGEGMPKTGTGPSMVKPFVRASQVPQQQEQEVVSTHLLKGTAAVGSRLSNS